jgi:molybdopterin/thiamine biosynthesis adenylyltransferase
MSLSNQQIERYARQIIVPGVGGTAQERLLSARLMLTGQASEIETVLAYMVGAGVGEIQLRLPARDTAERDPMIVRAAELNPDVVVKPAADNIAGLSLVLAIGEDLNWELMLSPTLAGEDVPLIVVHLSEPASIAILPRRPPCPLCADTDLLAPAKVRSDYAGFVTMVAATEAFKLLASSTLPQSPTLLQFNGFDCSIREIRQRPLDAECACSKRTKAS